ncbi:MAG: DUF2254 domain-containing protein [Pseudolabrys sp.]|nr:DUF2254 domain-containing protein [Pseudolabrys sp.]MDP2294303.1 DUF2254 domain-containing protein [Pseudolabrys sp.]
MIPRLLTLWESVRSSLWALPLTMMLGACALAYYALNAKIDIGDDPVWFLYSGTARQAPQFLSNLVTAMITMATLAISITMVVLTLAAQQLGPRLIRNFMGDWRTQASLGLFVSTVVYLLLVLRSSYGDGDTVANLAVTVGAALVLVSVTTLLLFVHHLAQSIIADNVIERVGEQLDNDIRRLLPEKDVDQAERPPEIDNEGAPVPLTVGGYIQAIDVGAIVEAATQTKALVKLDIRAGQHAIPGSIVGRVWPQAAAQGLLTDAIQSAVLIGGERTAVQDIEYSIHQLVEIALRALSPGINDPYTAIAALDRLTLSLCLVMSRGVARSVWQDDDGITRLVVPLSTFEGITDAAFNQIRQMSGGMPAVLIPMARNIGQLLGLANDLQRPALEKHLRLVVNAGGRGIIDEDDRNDLKDVATAARGKNAAARR